MSESETPPVQTVPDQQMEVPPAPPSGADLFSKVMGEGEQQQQQQQSAPPGPESPTGSTPEETGQPGGAFDYAFKGSESDSQGSQENPPQPPSDGVEGASGTPGPNGMTPEQAASQYVGDWLKKNYPEIPSFLEGSGDQKQIDSWQAARASREKDRKEIASLNLELAQLRKGAPAQSTGEGGQVMPESDAIAQLQNRIKELEPAATQWNETQAKTQIGDSIAFRQQFDAPRAAIVKELGIAAKKANLDEGAVDEFLALGSEFERTEWISTNSVEEDSNVAKFMLQKGNEFHSLTDQAEQELTAPNAMDRVKQWQDYEAAVSTQMATKMGESIKAQFQASYPQVRQRLLDPNQGDPLFFETEAGVGVLNEIASRLEQGTGFTPDEIITAMATSARADAYEALSVKLLARIDELTGNQQQQQNLEPANMGQGGGGGAAPPQGGQQQPANMPMVSSGRTNPMLTPEQMQQAGL